MQDEEYNFHRGNEMYKEIYHSFCFAGYYFHAIATANFNESTVKITVIMLIFFGISFTLGFYVKV